MCARARDEQREEKMVRDEKSRIVEQSNRTEQPRNYSIIRTNKKIQESVITIGKKSEIRVIRSGRKKERKKERQSLGRE